MVDVFAWGNRHGVGADALYELLHMMGMGFDSPQPEGDCAGMSEAAVTSRVLLEAPSKGVILWRNNVGALPDVTGRLVRYGLANDSKEMNKRIKSSDFIGLRKRLIFPHDVPVTGLLIGQGVAREMKEAGWTFNPHDEHEAAQAKFINLFNSYGGDAAFCTGVGSL